MPIIHISIILLYIVSFCVLISGLRNNQPRVLMTSIILWIIGLTTHLLLNYHLITENGTVNFGFSTTLSSVAWLICVLYLALLKWHRSFGLGLLLLPIAIICVAIAAMPHSQGKILTAESVSFGLKLHIATSILAYVVLALAAATSILLAYQHYCFRNHKTHWFLRQMPSMQKNENWLFYLLNTGFVFLSISLASGFVYLENLFEQDLAHKTIFGIVAWFVFGILLVQRHRAGWRGPKATNWMLGGFACLLIAYFGSKFVLEILLSSA